MTPIDRLAAAVDALIAQRVATGEPPFGEHLALAEAVSALRDLALAFPMAADDYAWRMLDALGES